MYSDVYLWWEALERQHSVESEIARKQLAGAVPRPRHPALRAGLARGLRHLANRLDGQAHSG